MDQADKYREGRGFWDGDDYFDDPMYTLDLSPSAKLVIYTYPNHWIARVEWSVVEYFEVLSLLRSTHTLEEAKAKAVSFALEAVRSRLNALQEVFSLLTAQS